MSFKIECYLFTFNVIFKYNPAPMPDLFIHVSVENSSLTPPNGQQLNPTTRECPPLVKTAVLLLS